MNAKEARAILNSTGTGHEYEKEFCRADGYLQCFAQTAEPLLEVIEQLRDAVICFQGALALHVGDGGAVTGDLLAADKIGEDARSSSAQVVENYNKEVLGE